MKKSVPLVQYLFRRLRQLNCHSIHGVPGDFFLRALDHIRPAGLNWIGNANELCAGYAADGYARAGHSISARRTQGPQVGALFTTLGVGELSAINAVAGSYAESIPIVHLVGTPSRKAWRTSSAKRPLHHTLGDGRMGIYAEMAKAITCAQAHFHLFEDANDAIQLYDETLRQCIHYSKPVYVSIPSDMMEISVAAEPLQKALVTSAPGNSSDIDKRLVDDVVRRIRSAKQPLIIADGLSYPLDLIEEANALAASAEIPAMSFVSGKGVIEEDSPYWLGTLSGPTEYSNDADLVLIAGPMLSDTNTAAWSAVPKCEQTVLVNNKTVEVDGRAYEVHGTQFLRRIVDKLRESPTVERRQTLNSLSSRPSSVEISTERRITQDAFWKRMSSFLRPEDTVILANGTPLIGGRDMKLPPHTQVVASSVWCSIGQMLPAAQGAALAKRDHGLPGRTILFEGDGSFQVTCQALSDIIRFELDITMFIVNNAGYTYERWLNGMNASYNDVPAWRYEQVASCFGAKEGDANYPVFTRRVETWEALEQLLAEGDLNDGRGLKVVDVVMDAEDVPKMSQAGLLRASEALRGL